MTQSGHGSSRRLPRRYVREKRFESSRVAPGGGDVPQPRNIGRKRQEDPRIAFAGVLRIDGVQRLADQERMKGRKQGQSSEESLKSAEEGTWFEDAEGDNGPPSTSA
jgi:hypothetical protein